MQDRGDGIIAGGVDISVLPMEKRGWQRVCNLRCVCMFSLKKDASMSAGHPRIKSRPRPAFSASPTADLFTLHSDSIDGRWGGWCMQTHINNRMYQHANSKHASEKI